MENQVVPIQEIGRSPFRKFGSYEFLDAGKEGGPGGYFGIMHDLGE